jgi:hypothetical protein
MRTEAENAEMLNSAHAAAWHWSRVGTELQNARATTLLGHVHALLGLPTALPYARRSFDYVQSNASPPWEVAFAHAILAGAAAAVGDGELHARHYESARELGAAIAEPEERAIFDATFRVVRRPA